MPNYYQVQKPDGGVHTRLTCSVRGGSISGMINGKPVHCAMRLSQGGTNLPPGEYQILPPQNDPIYGTIALVVPAGTAAAPQKRYASFMRSKHYLPLPGGQQITLSGIKRPAFGSTGAVFVLSGRPILGGNSIVVQSGFADLMDALKVDGGATLVVS